MLAAANSDNNNDPFVYNCSCSDFCCQAFAIHCLLAVAAVELDLRRLAMGIVIEHSIRKRSVDSKRSKNGVEVVNGNYVILSERSKNTVQNMCLNIQAVPNQSNSYV